jgi:hypothetical protein
MTAISPRRAGSVTARRGWWRPGSTKEPGMRLAILLLLTLFAACDHAQPSLVGTNCIHMGRNPIPVCQ